MMMMVVMIMILYHWNKVLLYSLTDWFPDWLSVMIKRVETVTDTDTYIENQTWGKDYCNKISILLKSESNVSKVVWVCVYGILIEEGG